MSVPLQLALLLLTAPQPVVLSVEAQGFSLTCPAGWEAPERALPAAAACVSPSEGDGDFMENVLVMVDPRPTSANARTALDVMLARNADHMTPLERGAMEGDGWTATTALTSDDMGRVTLSAAIRSDDRLYLLMCKASGRDAMTAYRPQFEEVIRSFRLQNIGGTTGSTASETERHQSPIGLSVSLPSGWTAIEEPDGPSSLALLGPEPAAGLIRPNIVVIARDYPRTVTVKELASALMGSLRQQWGNYREVSEAKTRVDGRKAKRLVFIGERGGIEVQVAVTIVADGTRSYLMLGVASPQAFAATDRTFAAIIDDLKLN